MVLIREYRVMMPLTLDEYARGQLYTTAAYSKSETSGGDGIEVVKNEPYEGHPTMGSGQYTYKIYHLSSKVPAWVRLIAPSGSLELHEEAWNGFPKIKTVLTNKYMGDKFRIVLESFHTAGRSQLENALGLPADVLKRREVVHLDIAKDKIEQKDYHPDQDPARVHSAKAQRGPLLQNWQTTAEPVMTVYKLFTAEFRVMGLQDRVESYIHKTNHYLILLFHRKLFCFLDQYHDMTIEDIRAFEDRTKQEMLENIKNARAEKEASEKAKPGKGKQGGHVGGGRSAENGASKSAPQAEAKAAELAPADHGERASASEPDSPTKDP